MNRVLYLARPDPDERELELTAISIYKSHNKDDSKVNTKLITALSESYYDLKNIYKSSDNEDFYGLRDFYNMIKQVSISISQSKIESKFDLVQIAKKSIERATKPTLVFSNSNKL